MPIDADRLRAHRFETIEQSYTRRDAILYALGIGLGSDPLDEPDFDYLLDTRDAVLPGFAGTLASPGMWIRDPAFGVDFARLVHIGQATRFHRPLPSAATVVAKPRVAELHDRGPGRGALLVVERTIGDAESGGAYATVRQSLLLRGDGGFGGPPPPATEAADPPSRPPDHRVASAISPRAALIYRLSGDWNPLHADPAAARAAGFPRPILHGLASYGLVAHLLERATGERLETLSCRFSGVVYPGDRLDLSIWRDGAELRFEARVDDRPVLSAGHAILHAPGAPDAG